MDKRGKEKQPWDKAAGSTASSHKPAILDEASSGPLTAYNLTFIFIYILFYLFLHGWVQRIFWSPHWPTCICCFLPPASLPHVIGEHVRSVFATSQLILSINLPICAFALFCLCQKTPQVNFFLQISLCVFSQILAFLSHFYNAILHNA